MTDTFRALCAELLAAIQLYTKLNPAASDMSAFELTEKLMDAMAATAVALAEPVAEGPTDEELDELAWNWYSKTCSTWYQIEAFRAFARAVLARWGHHPAPPAEGEVGA